MQTAHKLQVALLSTSAQKKPSHKASKSFLIWEPGASADTRAYTLSGASGQPGELLL